MRMIHRFQRMMPRVIRVTVAATALSLIASAALAKKVYGDVNDMAVHFGEELAKLPMDQTTGRIVEGDYYRLRMNDAPLNVASALTHAGVGKVLQRAEEDCGAHADGMATDFAHLEKVVQSNAPHAEAGSPGFGVVRSEAANKIGYVLCFANGGKYSPLEAWQQVAEAARTGELTKIGQVRYVTARKDGEGKTRVTAVWTDQPFNLFEMFPTTGDAPGSDAPNMPRPEGARRIFTAYAEGAPAAIRVYDVPMNSHDAHQFYQEKMPGAGFQPQLWTEDQRFGAAYSNPIADYIVVATEAPNGHSAVTITESRMRQVTVDTKPAP